MILVSFDGIALPRGDATQEVGTAEVNSTLVTSIGGYVDYVGNGRRKLARTMKITVSGLLYGETGYIIDEAGNRIVDETGNRQVIYPKNDLRSQVEQLYDRIGTVGRLIREYLDDGTQQWVDARLLKVSWDRKINERTIMANVTCTFETTMIAWRTMTVASLTSTIPEPFVIVNPGVRVTSNIPVLDAILTVTVTNAAVVEFSFYTGRVSTGTKNGCSFKWFGFATIGSVLVFDSGKKTVTLNGEPVYSGMTFDSVDHFRPAWIELVPSTQYCAYSITQAISGAAATATMSYYGQYL